MRHVTKGESPKAFEAWKNDPGWKPAYGDLRGAEKLELHRSLLAEQAQLCCYCGSEVGEADSHIEHFRPQSTYNHLELEYFNLHASCVRTPKGPRSAWHCGHAKQGDFCEERFIAPTDVACEGRFVYALSGAVFPAEADDEGAIYMRRLLGLDVEALRERRREALEEVFNDEFVRTADEAQLRQLASLWRTPGPDGRARKFGHVLARHAEQMIDDLRARANA